MMQGSTHELIEHFETPLGFFSNKAGLADHGGWYRREKAPRAESCPHRRT
jgi:hypothetical protein